MKRQITVFLLIIVFLFSGCDNQITANDNLNNPANLITPSATQYAIETVTPTTTQTQVITAAPVPENPKYIFIIIGDGMGQGAASLGEMYVRIAAGDMDASAVWENFPHQMIVGAMKDSSSGGTALATGCQSKQGYISLNLDQEPLYTIMDRAKEAGMSTGVVTNSFLSDATPATFITHTLSRYDYALLASQTAEGNVDFMAGGGLRYFGNKEQADQLPKEDCYGIELSYSGSANLLPQLLECGYNLYYGDEGAKILSERVRDDEYPYEKCIYSLSSSYMPWEIDKYDAKKSADFNNVPTLCEMTEAGIGNLSQNPNGFVIMVEEAFIDRAAHMSSTIRAIYQMKLLDETMQVIMDFYYEHPDETLVILTADHETGGYLYNEELFNKFKELPDFQWTDNGDDLSEFLKSQWGFYGFESYYYKQIENSKSDVWENQDDAGAQLFADITEVASRKYGTIITTDGHTLQPVPLYTIGNSSEVFENCTHISEIPGLICEIMGWDPLPEAIKD